MEQEMKNEQMSSREKDIMMEEHTENNFFSMQHSIFPNEDSTIQESNAADDSDFDSTKDSCNEEEEGKHTSYNVEVLIDEQDSTIQESNAADDSDFDDTKDSCNEEEEGKHTSYNVEVLIDEQDSTIQESNAADDSDFDSTKDTCVEEEEGKHTNYNVEVLIDDQESEPDGSNALGEISFSDYEGEPLLSENSSQILQWFQEKKLIKAELKCESCSHWMKWTIQPKSIDGYDWRCRNDKCVKYRVNLKTIRHGSFFAKSKMSLSTWFDIMFLWSKHVGIQEASEQMTISRKTIHTCYRFFKEVCEVYFKSNPIKLGGPRITLDMDVFSLTQKKSRKGPPISIFCIVDSNSSPSIGYMEIVEKMDVTTLFPIILKVVEPGSVVHTKDWREYCKIQTFSDMNGIVNPFIHFVDVNDSLHKENIESYRNNHKSFITAMFGCKRILLNSYLQEFMWRERFSNNTLESLCEHIAVQFSDGKYNDRTNDSFLKKETEQQKLLARITKSCFEIGQKKQGSNDAVGYTDDRGPESEIENPSDENMLDCHSSQSLFIKDSSKVIQWFQEKKVIKTELKCETCSHWMIWTIQPKSTDGFDWRCRNKECVKCRKTPKSIRHGSLFAKSKMSLPKWYDIMFLWSNYIGLQETSEQMNISTKTISTCFTLFKEVCGVYFKSNPIKLGGPRITLDIDVFCLIEKSRSKTGSAVWICCIVDSNCSPSIGYMEIVEKTDVATLFPIIMKVVEPGSTIHTKDWREYLEIQDFSEEDKIVNPSIHFVDVNEGLHKENIKLYGNNHKRVISAMSGCKRNLVNSYLQEFMWRERFSDNTLESLCEQIVVQFSDGKYSDSTNDSFIKKELVHQKTLEINTESENYMDCLEVEIEENTNYLEEPPSKKSCYGIGQEIQNRSNSIGSTNDERPNHEFENTSYEIPVVDDSYLPLFCNDSSKVIQWFQRRNLIKSELMCESCSHLMQWNVQPKVVDGYDWRCRNTKCVKNRVNCKTIRTGSFFAKSKLSLPKWFDIMYLWSEHYGVKNTSEQVNICCETIGSCYRFFKEVCEVYFKSNPIKIGGPRISLDIDVFCLIPLSKRRNVPAVWVFCIVDSNSSPPVGYMEIVEEMDVAKLFPIIMKVVEPGSIIHTKDWREYLEIQAFSDRARIANPSIHFMDVNAILHKENLELYCNYHKSVITAMSGCNRNKLNSYLQEFMWRERFSENTLESLCEQIVVQFSNGKYIDRTNYSFLKKALVQQKHKLPSKKSCFGVGHEILNRHNAIVSNDGQGPNHEFENTSDEIPDGDESSLPLFCEDTSKVIKWFQRRNLIKSELKCESCSHLMIWDVQPRFLDGYNWRCRNNKCIKFSKINLSIRLGSFFAKSKLSLPKWLDIMYLWSNHVGVKETSEHVNISCKTISGCHSFFKEVCEVYFKSNPIKIGGPRISLDIDVFCLIQTSRRRNVPAVWVFCIVDSNSSPSIGYMEIVEEMDVANLFPIIMKVVEPGSIIHTKDWREYCEIQAFSDRDRIVNPSIHFVDVNARIHKENIESYGNPHKSVITAMSGIKRSLVNSVLLEFMWRERFSDNTLESLCQHIAVQFSDVAYNARTNDSNLE